jgi:lysozyme
MSVRDRWLQKLNTARLWEKIARQRYIWHPTAGNRRRLKDRREQVAAAERVLKRHPAQPEALPARGIDVSHYQGRVDFAKLKKAGFDFAIVQSGDGDYRDPTFAANVKAATAAGLHVGAYHFVRPKPGRTGAQEARLFIDRLRATGLGRGDLRPTLDVEATKLDRAGTHAYVAAFVKAMQNAGYEPMIYTGAWFWDPNMPADDFGLPLWVSGYVPEHDLRLPKPWTHYAIWQYGDHGHVPGTSGPVDLDKTPDLHAVIA